jgi:hypothetical protein
MEIKVILVICIFNFFIYLYFFLLHYNKITLIFLFFFYTEFTQMKLDSNEDDILTIDVDSSDIPKSSGTESVNLS